MTGIEPATFCMASRRPASGPHPRTRCCGHRANRTDIRLRLPGEPAPCLPRTGARPSIVRAVTDPVPTLGIEPWPTSVSPTPAEAWDGDVSSLPVVTTDILSPHQANRPSLPDGNAHRFSPG